MNKFLSSKALKIVLIVCLILGINSSLLSYVIFNRGDELFITNNPPTSYNSSSTTIQKCIIHGAAIFLDSYAHTLSFLRAVEMSDITGIDQEELKSQIGQAVKGMAVARDTYKTLYKIAGVTPYNPDMVERLMAFDYDTFRESKGLSTAVFAEVATFLKKGDVRGVFGKLLSGNETILKMLIGIQADVDCGKFPYIEKLWRINDIFIDTMRFGQYTAEVFYAIGNRH